jgi:hypothetical protein
LPDGILFLMIIPLEFAGFVHSLHETVKGEWFKKVIQRIQVKSFDGILTVGRGKDDHCLLRDLLVELQTRNRGHPDVEKYQVGLVKVFSSSTDSTLPQKVSSTPNAGGSSSNAMALIMRDL